MSEVRGYPNPNYTEDDIMTEEEMEELGMVYVDLEHYEELVSKAAALDILKASLQKSGSVKDDVVLAVTGAALDAEAIELKQTADRYWEQYWAEHQKVETLEKKLVQKEMENRTLADLLKDSDIGAEKEE